MRKKEIDLDIKRKYNPMQSVQELDVTNIFLKMKDLIISKNRVSKICSKDFKKILYFKNFFNEMNAKMLIVGPTDRLTDLLICGHSK